ncbi:CBS domain-containing protein [Coleofasciculus sp. H7-2]|uniref:CBS domain-containing protein n=1 Tax=Coleofasciculus sp. H7-2 TaxID=3351545 RepID=UPI003672A277
MQHHHNLLSYSPAVDHVIDPSPLIVTPDTPLADVITLMGRVRSSCLLTSGNAAPEDSLMGEARAGYVLVVERRQLVGMFTERDVVRLTAAGMNLASVKIREVMTSPVITLELSAFRDIFTALSLLRRHHIRHLPIVESQVQLVGVVTPDSIRQVMQPTNLLKWQCVAEVMIAQIIQAPPSASVLSLAQLMAKHRVSCVVITEADRENLIRPVGIFTERDLVQMQTIGLDLSQNQAETVMSTPLFCVSPEDTLWTVHQEMQRRYVQRIVVTGSAGNLLGIVTQTSLLQAFDPVEMYGTVELLQQLVEVRTSELSNANHQLQREILERKRAEEELQKALEKEKELSDLKSRFAGMVSHEFRNPLTTIINLADLLKYYSHRLTDEKKLKYLNHIEASAKDMNKLIDELLVIAKAEAGKLDFKPALLNLVQWCAELIEEIQLVYDNRNAIAFESYGVDTDVYLDEKLLRHILTNLLTNAIKYSSPGSTVHFELWFQAGDAVFQIQDSGIGIPVEDRERLFESFHRAKNVGNIPGTGLGLTIAKKCVELHGGKIAVKSEVGVGTTFTISVPLYNGISIPKRNSSGCAVTHYMNEGC